MRTVVRVKGSSHERDIRRDAVVPRGRARGGRQQDPARESAARHSHHPGQARKAVAELSDWAQLREAGRQIKDHTLRHLDRYLMQLEEAVTPRAAPSTGRPTRTRPTGSSPDWSSDRRVRGRQGQVHGHAGDRPQRSAGGGGHPGVRDRSPSSSCSWARTAPPTSWSPRSTATAARSATSSAPRWANGAPGPRRADRHTRRTGRGGPAALREKFLRAKVGISGANFMVAETGTLVVVESEGNGRMCLTLPETLISVVGIEKIVPTWRDLEVFPADTPRSSTAERMNPYTSMWTGTTDAETADGPRAFHLVLLDNGRTDTLSDQVGRQALRCIRCSACLNVCPVYERAGGHAYGSVYPGPIGAILSPQLRGPRARSTPRCRTRPRCAGPATRCARSPSTSRRCWCISGSGSWRAGP